MVPASVIGNSESGGSCHCAVDRCAVKRQSHRHQRTAGYSHQRGAEADREAVASHRGVPRQFVAQHQAVAPDQKFCRDQAGNQDECQLERVGWRDRGKGRPDDDTRHRGQRPAAHDLRKHEPALLVRAVGAHRRRHDDRHRGADAELHTHSLRYAENTEHLKQHRDDNRAAADAEQPGKDAGHDAGDHDACRQPCKLANHFVSKDLASAGAIVIARSKATKQSPLITHLAGDCFVAVLLAMTAPN